MTPGAGKLAFVRRLAWMCATLVFAVTSLSAFVRLARAAGMTGTTGFDAARYAHRVAATGALLAAIVLLIQCLGREPQLPRPGRYAFGVVVLGLFLAIVGRFGGESTSPLVVFANLGGGFVMLSLACLMALSCTMEPARRVAGCTLLATAVLIGAAGGVAQLLAGAQVATGVAYNMAAALFVAGTVALIVRA